MLRQNGLAGDPLRWRDASSKLFRTSKIERFAVSSSVLSACGYIVYAEARCRCFQGEELGINIGSAEVGSSAHHGYGQGNWSCGFERAGWHRKTCISIERVGQITRHRRARRRPLLNHHCLHSRLGRLNCRSAIDTPHLEQKHRSFMAWRQRCRANYHRHNKCDTRPTLRA